MIPAARCHTAVMTGGIGLHMVHTSVAVGGQPSIAAIVAGFTASSDRRSYRLERSRSARARQTGQTATLHSLRQGSRRFGVSFYVWTVAFGGLVEPFWC